MTRGEGGIEGHALSVDSESHSRQNRNLSRRAALCVCQFRPQGSIAVDDTQIGWVAAIILGGIAGWLAEIITRSNMGLITNIILGMIGAAFASWLFAKLGIAMGGPQWLGYLVAGFVGACILILATRLLYPERWRT